MSNRTECTADGINFSWCGSLNDFGPPQWWVQEFWIIQQQKCGIIRKDDIPLFLAKISIILGFG